MMPDNIDNWEGVVPLLFNSLLLQFGIELSGVRLLRHQDQRAEKGRTPYQLWRDDRPAFEAYQSTQSFGNRSRLSPSTYWVSFVVTPMQETLLAGIYHSQYRGPNDVDIAWTHADGIDLAGTCDVYELRLDEQATDLEGRVVIDWGAGTRTWIQRADSQNKVVIEIAREFKEPSFPGFIHFIEPLSRIENLPPEWKSNLSNARGVYLLTNPGTHEQYVGSASGELGFWGRWLNYVQTGHGGNVGLKANPSDYQVSILEVASSAATRDDIIRLEELWKVKLKSREMGLNR
jgi:hypothetical protein